MRYICAITSRIDPILRRRCAILRWTKETQPPRPARATDNIDLPANKSCAATTAAAFVVEGLPFPIPIEATKDQQFVARSEPDWH